MKVKVVSLILLVSLLMTACNKDNETNGSENLYLNSAEKVATYPKNLIKTTINNIGDFAELADRVNCDVDLYKVAYKTIYTDKPINASGVFLIPKNIDKTKPTVIYNHGTITKSETPSLTLFPSDEIAAYIGIAAIHNCIVVIPDYIGYGQSASITHPYMHAESLSSAGYDILMACKEYSEGNRGIATGFNSNIFITGYSEGGYAAVALQKKIQESKSTLKVHKNIAGSGAYDLLATIENVVSIDEDVNSKFISSYLWVLGMVKNDFLYSKDYSKIFSEKDHILLRGINFDMAYFKPIGISGLSSNPKNLFNSDFVTGITSGSDTELITILKSNSFVDFNPTDSLVFVYGLSDKWVLPINSENAYNAMKKKGYKVRKIQTSGDHGTTYIPYILAVSESLSL